MYMYTDCTRDVGGGKWFMRLIIMEIHETLSEKHQRNWNKLGKIEKK